MIRCWGGQTWVWLLCETTVGPAAGKKAPSWGKRQSSEFGEMSERSLDLSLYPSTCLVEKHCGWKGAWGPSLSCLLYP